MLHYYAWYPKDWLTSLTRLEMPAAARAIYRDLLDYCYLDGSIPTDDDALQRLAAVSPAEWKRYSPVVRKQFFFGDDGFLHHRKVDEKRPECLAHYEQKVNAGRASGEARRERKLNARSSERSNDRSNETSTDVGTKRELALTLTLPVPSPPTPSPNENGDFDFLEWFESLYESWSVKGHKDQACRALATHSGIGNPEWRANVVRKARAWSEYYAGRYVKKAFLFEWVNDEGWRYDPPVEKERTATVEFSGTGQTCSKCLGSGVTRKAGAPQCPDPRDDEAAFAEWQREWKEPCSCEAGRAVCAV